MKIDAFDGFANTPVNMGQGIQGVSLNVCAVSGVNVEIWGSKTSKCRVVHDGGFKIFSVKLPFPTF